MAENKIEFVGNYKGYTYIVIMTTMGHRCGYVKLNRIRDKHYVYRNEDEIDIICHGRITYSKPYLSVIDNDSPDSWYIGFNCAHFGDIPAFDDAMKWFKDDKETLAFLEDRKATAKEIPLLFDGEVRTLEFCKSECMKIIDQISQK